jgi:hypothetical protein
LYHHWSAACAPTANGVQRVCCTALEIDLCCAAPGVRFVLYCLDCGLCLVPVVPPPRRFVLYCLECAARWARLQADDGKVWVLFDLSGENGKKEEMAEIMQRHTRARARPPPYAQAWLLGTWMRARSAPASGCWPSTTRSAWPAASCEAPVGRGGRSVRGTRADSTPPPPRACRRPLAWGACACGAHGAW